MARIITLLAAAACVLSACSSTPPLESSALDAVDAPQSSLRRDCERPSPGIVCVREMRPDSDGRCTCVETDRLHTLGLFPGSP